MLVDGTPSEKDLEFAARIAARYSQGRTAESLTVSITDKQGQSKEIDVVPMPPNKIPENWYI